MEPTGVPLSPLTPSPPGRPGVPASPCQHQKMCLDFQDGNTADQRGEGDSLSLLEDLLALEAPRPPEKETHVFRHLIKTQHVFSLGFSLRGGTFGPGLPGKPSAPRSPCSPFRDTNNPQETFITQTRSSRASSLQPDQRLSKRNRWWRAFLQKQWW